MTHDLGPVDRKRDGREEGGGSAGGGADAGGRRSAPWLARSQPTAGRRPGEGGVLVTRKVIRNVTRTHGPGQPALPGQPEGRLTGRLAVTQTRSRAPSLTD